MIIECSYCKAKVDAKVLAQHDEFDPEEDAFPFRASLLVCPSCKNSMLAGQELVDTRGGNQIWNSASRLWPSPKQYLSLDIPAVVRNSIEEARKCLAARAYTAAVAMSGRALEGICRHFKTKSQYLGGGLKELRDREIIDSRLFDWSEALRKHRNMAAHATKEKATEANARDLLNFVESISEYVFVLSARFEEFKKRETRAAAKKKSAAKKKDAAKKP